MTKPITAQELEELFGKIDFEQLVKDEVLKECAEEIQRQYDKHLMTILYGTPGEVMKYNRKMNFIEKLDAGWWWFFRCAEEWGWTMTHDDGEFFNYIQSDYVRYEEDMYYE